MSRTAAPLPLRLYSAAANLLGPLAYARVRRKLAAHGTPPARWPERMGHATLPRPDGRLVWFHAASVGESVSVLRLIAHWAETRPDLEFLLTSGTATSAQVVASRLPPRTRHQFAPLDTQAAVRRFLAHWRPDAAIFVESELWPQMLHESHAADIPLALLNARISDRSARNWQRAPRTARHLMGIFRIIRCQDARTVAHLHSIGLDRAQQGPNLKSLSGPLPFDHDEQTRLTAQIGDRPLWLAASTHPGEDEIMLAAHQSLLATCPDALLILVPRHPERGLALETLIAAHRLDAARRAIGDRITARTQVYLADTLGETGLWYALCPLTCLCGSFTPVGGHTPYEPAHAGSAILHGPLYANFSEIYPALDASGAAREVADAAELVRALVGLLDDPAALDTMRRNARNFAATQEDALDQITADLSTALGLAP
ncbi:3-deoxy-D-manno-octulosonic-acid transferase [Roseovarius azorensis]|uniref:3-deoxy-D-manno-octulosonic acid transferase n=1 Tax=Roseovarius azorensis TaxID=1287727 RepID=A0A1H7MGN8_9RHOB|nr:3-deoxy-D-manno-octulosonic acid transferase [Roseovarius azorensis]SEL09777.1 3-deoxy-D-manno-octulosonic-acid transferase [Roseovarius azorensis]